MRTNCDLTLYNKYVDPSDKSEKYQRTVIKKVSWENRKASNVLRTGGNISVDTATIFVPFQRGSQYLLPHAWMGLEDKSEKWTFQEGDVLVKGIVTDTISSMFTVSALKKKYDNVLIVSSVDTMDLGSLSMRHWKIGAK